MNTVASGGGLLSRERALPVQTYATVAGVLLLLTFVAGGCGEAYVPSKVIVATDAAATVENLKPSELMFRLGFAAYLVEACCDVMLALIFYVLLKPVHRYVSLSRRQIYRSFGALLATHCSFGCWPEPFPSKRRRARAETAYSFTRIVGLFIS